MSSEPDSQRETWEGQQAMGERLVSEAIGDTPVAFFPGHDRVVVYPVVPDEKRPVDLTIVQLGGQDLPDIGVIVAVSWDVNAQLLEEAAELDRKIAAGELDASVKEWFFNSKAYRPGDIVVVNKFSGMDVPGTNFIMCSIKDVGGKLLNFPVRLRRSADVEQAVREAQVRLQEVDSEVVAPSSKLVTARG